MQILFDNWTGRYDDECLMPGDIVEAAMVYNFRENAGNQTDTMIQMSEVADIVSNLPIYDTIYKENRYSPWKYAGQCYPGELQNRNPALMPMCYICSRYRADTREELEENIRVAKWAANKVVSEGKIPIAPHLYFPRFMDDSIAEERYFGMEAGKRLMMQCKEFLVVTVDNVISEGMNEEIDYMTNKLMMQGKSINFTRKNKRVHKSTSRCAIVVAWSTRGQTTRSHPTTPLAPLREDMAQGIRACAVSSFACRRGTASP